MSDRFIAIIEKVAPDSSKFKEFIIDLSQDSYPPISLEEAQKRVVKAVESYQNGTMEIISHDEAWAQIDKHIESKT